MSSDLTDRYRALRERMAADPEMGLDVLRALFEDLGTVTISIGLAERVRGESAGALVGRADEALYASKRGGRNRLTMAAEASAKAA